MADLSMARFVAAGIVRQQQDDFDHARSAAEGVSSYKVAASKTQLLKQFRRQLNDMRHAALASKGLRW